MTTRARLGAHLASLALILGAMVLLQGRAEASCALPPQRSPHAFTGTVISVSDAGRTAHVRTDDARTVTVLGGHSPAANGASSTDRRYAVGGRYEFHPINGASPFQDNACTGTRQLSGPPPSAYDTSADRLPGWLSVDEDAGPAGYSILAVLLLGGFAVLAATVVLARRLWSRRGPSPLEEHAETGS